MKKKEIEIVINIYKDIFKKKFGTDDFVLEVKDQPDRFNIVISFLFMGNLSTVIEIEEKGLTQKMLIDILEKMKKATVQGIIRKYIEINEKEIS